MQTIIPLTEQFDDTRGEIWKNHDAYQPIDRANMAGLKHVDIRTFDQNDLTRPRTVLELSTLTVGQLSTQSMNTLGVATTLGGGEKWQFAECEEVVGNGYVNSLNVLADTSGVVSASSVIPKKYGDLQVPSYTNLCPNPNFESATTGWSGTVATDNHLTTSGATIARSQAVMPHSGTRSGVLSGFSGASVGSGTAIQIPGTFKAGVKYTASIWIRKSTGSASELSLYFGQDTDRITGGFGTVSTTWVQKKVEWTPAADKTNVFLTVMASNISAASSTYHIDDILVTETDTAGQPAYFDGNIPNHIWLGTPNLSQSAGPYDIEPEISDLCQNLGDILYCSNGTWTGTVTELTEFRYQWKRDGVDIPEATYQTYTLVKDDQQADLTCVVTIQTVGDPEDLNDGTVLGTASSDGVTSTSSGLVIATYPTIDGHRGFYNDDHVVLSAPSWTAGTTLASSYLDLTSNASGDFTAGPTASVAFSAAVAAPVNGSPAELRFLRSQFNQNDIDLAQVTGVRIRITSSNGTPTNHTFVGGVRLLSKNWKYSAQDIDTRLGRLRKTVPRNADQATVPDFTWPILWRSNSPSGQNDPKPIDSEFGVEFYTGTIVNSNTISLYFREVTADFLTQLDINGIHQSQLNGYDQPDIGTAKYNSRTMIDLAEFDQSELEDESQFSLERTPDYLSASWVQTFLQWGSGGAGSVTFVSSETPEGGGYTLPLPTVLTANTRYLYRVRMEENSLRASIYSLDATGIVTAKVFDSNTVIDSFSFKRRAGRFGWATDIKDGSAWVDAIRERYANFGEYRSLPLRSNTPVDGAELFVSASPNVERVTGVEPGQYNSSKTSVAPDNSHSVSGSSTKVSSSDSTPLQGLQTNVFSISDWENSRAEFDVFCSSTSRLMALLVDKSNQRVVELVLPDIVKGSVWQHVVIDFPYDALLSGEYKLLIVQKQSTSEPWWVDNLSVFSRSVVWEGRSVTDDPWKSNNALWTAFREVHSRTDGGVLFPKRGTDLQIRAKALKQDAEISRIQFKPKYSALGVIPVPEPIYGYQYGYGTGKPITGTITGLFSVSTPGGAPPLTRRFTGSGTSTYGGGSSIVQYTWSFGDGSVGYGQVVDHTFDAAATYTVILTVTDNFGYQATYTQGVGVS
jgi:hypothetical protein